VKRPVLPLAAAALIVLTAVASTIFWARLPGRLPTDDDYRRVNDLLASQAQPGDIAVLAPAYADRGRQFITAVPVYAGYDLGGDVYEGTKRQWLVALPDAPRFSLEAARGELLSRGTSAAGGQRVGELYVEPFSIIGPPVAFSFLDAAADADVSIGGGHPTVCRVTRNGAHQCSNQDWNRVQPGWYEIQERPAHCVWAHPVGQDPVLITYRNVPVAPGSKIAGWVALADQTPAVAGAPEVNLGIDVDGRALDRVTLPNQWGKMPFERLLPSGPDHATITFAVTSPNPGLRHFCYDAWVQPAQ